MAPDDKNTRTDKTFKLLAVGNSFSVDTLEHVYGIAEAAGYEDIVLGNLYIGGCPLHLHAQNLTLDTRPYTYFYNNTGRWENRGATNIPDMIGAEQWDWVSLQQSSSLSGKPETFEPHLSELITYIKTHAPGARLFWNMTWAYPADSAIDAFGLYGRDQLTMYRAITAAVRKVICPYIEAGELSALVPAGTAVQNVRTSYYGDRLCRDGLHLSYDTGRFIAGMALVRALSGVEFSRFKALACPPSVDARLLAVIKEAVTNACASPFKITPATDAPLAATTAAPTA